MQNNAACHIRRDCAANKVDYREKERASSLDAKVPPLIQELPELDGGKMLHAGLALVRYEMRCGRL